MRIAVAQLGARMHYAVPRILHEAGLLERLFTDAYVGNKPWLEAVLRRISRQIRHRNLDHWLGRNERSIPAEKVTSFDVLGVDYQRRLRSAGDIAATRRVFHWAGKQLGTRISRAGFGDADTVWGFNDASLELFTAAKRSGLRCVVEQTIAPLPVENRLLRTEMSRWPDWQPSLKVAADVSEDEGRQAAERELADLIVCGSKFVVDGIAECHGPVEKCRIVPYGVDVAAFPTKSPRHRSPGDRLRVLFAGEVGLRKGAPWLLEALRSLGSDVVEARFAGSLALSRAMLAPYAEFATFLGAVPRSRMAEHFAWADIFVLPSVCEGSATVTYEAVASGLPVICTPNTGALPSEAVTIVPAGDSLRLAEEIKCHANNSKPSVIAPSARSNYCIEAYAKRLVTAIHSLDRKTQNAVPTLAV